VGRKTLTQSINQMGTQSTDSSHGQLPTAPHCLLIGQLTTKKRKPAPFMPMPLLQSLCALFSS